MDEYFEQHQIKMVNSFDKTLILLRNICFCIFVLYSIFMSFGVAVMFFGLWLFIFILCRNVFVDYDYEYYYGEVVISRIILKKKRKVIATLKTSQLIKVCNSSECKKTIKATTNKNEIQTYVFQTTIGEIGFILSLNDKMKEFIMKGV